MTDTVWTDQVLSHMAQLSPQARRLLRADSLISDRLRRLASQLRAPVIAGTNEIATTDVSELRRSLREVIDSLKQQVSQVIDLRSRSERNAERLLIAGGVIVLALPIGLTASNLLGIATGWISTLFNGLSTAGFAALMFGPGREIRKAAKDRTALLLLPIGFEARVAAATTSQELQTIAGDLETTLRSMSVGSD